MKWNKIVESIRGSQYSSSGPLSSGIFDKTAHFQLCLWYYVSNFCADHNLVRLWQRTFFGPRKKINPPNFAVLSLNRFIFFLIVLSTVFLLRPFCYKKGILLLRGKRNVTKRYYKLRGLFNCQRFSVVSQRPLAVYAFWGVFTFLLFMILGNDEDLDFGFCFKRVSRSKYQSEPDDDDKTVPTHDSPVASKACLARVALHPRVWCAKD